MFELSVQELLDLWQDAKLLVGSPTKQVGNLVSDSRNEVKGKTFIALKGKRFDGHDYLARAIEREAAALVIDQSSKADQQLMELAEAKHCQIILVADTWQAFFAYAKYCRQNYQNPVVCVTGSVGKTSSRRMIATALSSQGLVVETADNLNNEIGISQTLFRLAEQQSNYAVIEMGIDEVGEMARETRLAQPDIAVITNIGYSHIDHFKTRQILLREKTSILNGLRPNGVLVIPFNDELLRHYALFHSLAQHLRLYFYGLAEDYQEDYRQAFPEQTIWVIAGQRQLNQNASKNAVKSSSKKASGAETTEDNAPNLHPKEVAQSFTINIYQGNKELKPEQEQLNQGKNSWPISQSVPVKLALAGKHHAQNACLALTVSLAINCDLNLAAQALASYQGAAGRERLIKAGDCLLLDDSYNAASMSFAAALDTAKHLLAGKQQYRRLLAVFGSINELGEYSEAEHYKVGVSLAKHAVDAIYLLGHGAQAMKEGYLAEIQASQQKSAPIVIYPDKQVLTEALLQDIRSNDLVLFKGSHSFALGEVVEQVCAELDYRQSMAETSD